MAPPAPLAFEPHAAAWVVVAMAMASVVAAHRHLRRASEGRSPWGRRRMVAFAGGGVALVVTLTWPLADLARQWSLTMLVLQRVLLLLVVAPLLWIGLPDDVLAALTRPPPIDALLARLQRPPVAVAVVTLVSIGSMTPGLVRLQASSTLARGIIDAVVVLAGVVLWLPVIGRLPGTPRPKPVVRFGYLIFQAVVPAFLSFIYIFSTHPLYRTFSGSKAALGLRPLTDQQVAGFVSKLSMLIALLTVGSVVLARASVTEDDTVDEPLIWSDVERAFERADRARQRSDGAGGEAGGRADDPATSDPDRPEQLYRPRTDPNGRGRSEGEPS